jgi:protein-tyrosine-phosphatase
LKIIRDDAVDVDWARYNQQVLFVDSSDTVRARMAAGIMEIVANWNGWGMVLVTDRCGVDALPGTYMDPSMAMALLGRAQPMGVSSRHFTRAVQVFEVDDLYRYDLVVALDSKTKAKILEMASQETKSAFTSRYFDYFHNKIAQLSDFNSWCSDEHLLRTGGSALLPRKLSLELGMALPRARATTDIVRPNLSAADAEGEWEAMQLSILLGVAGSLQFLIDSCPDDLPHWSTLGQHD